MGVATLTMCGDPAAVESGWARLGPGGLVSRVAAQPGSSLVWLQSAQRPWPLSALVGPPTASGRMWSACRTGAPHHGVRQYWSRWTSRARSCPSNPPSSRVHGDQAPVGRGRVQPAQPDPCPAFGRSTADVGGVRHELAGERGRDGRARQARRVQPRGGVSCPSSRAVSVMTSPTSMLTSSACACPVRRSVNASAITWSRERGSPVATRCAPATRQGRRADKPPGAAYRVLRSTRGTATSRARASRGTGRVPRRPRRSCRPGGSPPRRTPAGPSARRRRG